MTPDDIVALAARLRALEQVAYSADIYLEHIKGFRLHTDDGPVDLMNTNMPEAIALQQALDAWHATSAEQGKHER